MKEILVTVDFSSATEAAIEKALEVACAFGSHARLLHVAPPDPTFGHARSWPQEVRDEMAKELKSEHDQLRTFADRFEKAGITAKAVVARGSIAETILEYARKSGTDLIVVGANPEGAVMRFLPQSVVRTILRTAPCPVLVVPANTSSTTLPPSPNG